MFARALVLPLDGATARTGFTDAEEIPAWASQSANALAGAGIVRSKGGNRFAPLDNATRAEVCVLILKALSYN
ncbi:MULTISPECIES: S-layer homology domain-containing protein [Paenibacillus]|uniref:S-layer homology domain-containing protein n=1 Tax=Paenibacillus TaxID=44249 RepID=UPI00164EBA9F|nr:MULTISPECIES: S-layer homology domain-containing protein [Paenibacillus]QNK58686.1 S-layer homology domain-containing protein [Paenibacillus sp. PAMC21692]